MKQSYDEKIQQLMKLSGNTKRSCSSFIKFVAQYLNSCGYFMGDLNIHNLPIPENHIKYCDKDFGTWLLDMALIYNMEQGIEYECKLKTKNENI